MAPTHADHLISVDEVRSRADLKAFVHLPRDLYLSDPDYVQPLDHDIYGRLEQLCELDREIPAGRRAAELS